MKRLMLTCMCLASLILAFPLCSVAQDYVIGDGDVLNISVWGMPDLSSNVTVRPDGKITIPAAGEVLASGLTPVKLGEELTIVLTKYVKKPIVTVSVASITNNRVYIFGGGIPSRVVNLPGRTTLFKLLCSLEGVENADLRHAYLSRRGEKVVRDFYDMFLTGDLAQDIEIEAEDNIFLPTNERNKIYVAGAVAAAKYIYYREGISVLDAILEAGGFSDYAKEDGVTIIRNRTEKIVVNLEKLLKGKDMKQNVPLAPGDYVIVEEGMF